ncbi:SDR family NAD(P)-dependent oxidoreductase [Saccharothrix sp. 6-C]|uniref:Short-subunit dehydrogenase n=1 Tax=Saccharothrix texasensis TaxID=103734 RepID=A0A3N1HBT0_9PSEU|nr:MULTISPECIES: SDR family NAD(P)-dependent oxidoreductase [Saccharothrix]QQQ75882.1 SDR family NAD(P)-dependent oxidoreductase [Saccharothrix sp. 6-C]ROP39955.1 short-subunit dehydrogenase [Saccharothrix texasensis]
MRVSGSTVLVTGATGGIGQAIARALAGRGAEVVLTGRKVAELERLAAEVGGRAVAADLAEPGAAGRLVAEAGAVDVLVANAALPASGALVDFTAEQVKRALAVNLEAPIALTHELVPSMLTARRGHVVLIGSLAGKVASAHASLYNATKFGLRGFALGLREDLRGSGVGVSIVQPGFVRDAGMFADTGAKPPAGMRTVSPEEVAAAVVKAIEEDRGELTVAPPELRVASVLGGAFPAFSSGLQRRLSNDELMKRMGTANRGKR